MWIVYLTINGIPTAPWALEQDRRLGVAGCGWDPVKISINGVGGLFGADGVTQDTWEYLVDNIFEDEDNVGTAENPLRLALEPLPVRGDIELCVKLSKSGFAAEEDFFFELRPPYTIQAINAFLESKEDALMFEDINLWLLPNGQLLDADLLKQVAQQHVSEGTPLHIEWESRISKDFSELNIDQGMALLGLPEECISFGGDAPLSPVVHTQPLPESIRKAIPKWAASDCATIDDLFNHFAEDLFLRLRVSPDPAMSCRMDTNRELISPVLHCVASLIPNTLVRANKRVTGQRSHGTIDYVLDHLGVSVICIEAKLHDRMWDHLGQLSGAIRAERDALRRKVLELGKYKYDSTSSSTEEQQAVGRLKKMPTFALLTNGMRYITFKYTEDPLGMVQFQFVPLPSSMGTSHCKFQELKDSMVEIVQHLMSLLEYQIKDASEFLPEKCLKKARHYM